MFIKGKNGESRKAKDLSTTSKHYSRGKRKLEQNRAEAAVGQSLHMGAVVHQQSRSPAAEREGGHRVQSSKHFYDKCVFSYISTLLF